MTYTRPPTRFHPGLPNTGSTLPDIATTTPAAPDHTLTAALLDLGGRATLGDVVSATGLPDHEAETALKGLLETHRGHLEVSDAGDLLYQFDPKLIARDRVPFGVRFRKAAWSAFKTGFKVLTAVVLVAYVVIFVLLILALMFANKDDRGGIGGGRRGGGFGLGDFLLLHWLMGGRGWNRRSLHYGDRPARRLPKEAQPPFYKKVFAFIFGPDACARRSPDNAAPGNGLGRAQATIHLPFRGRVRAIRWMSMKGTPASFSRYDAT